MMSLNDTQHTLLASLIVAACVVAVPAAPSKPAGYVTDGAGILSGSTEGALENVMAELEQKAGAQIAVVTMGSLDGRDVAEVAERLFRDWGIGNKGKDDGILLLVAPAERKTRIEVGYGLEGLIPDARAGRILDEQALPRFRNGDMEGGVAATALALAKIVAEDKGVELTGVSGVDGNPQRAPAWIVLLMMAFFGILVIRHPWMLFFLLNSRGHRGGGSWGGGGFGGLGGFGGGGSGGGGASRGW